MRQPKKEFDLTKIISKLISKKDASMIVYTLKLKSLFGDEFDGNKIERTDEKVVNYSMTARTWRYDGEFLFRRFPDDLQGFKWRYELEDRNLPF